MGSLGFVSGVLMRFFLVTPLVFFLSLFGCETSTEIVDEAVVKSKPKSDTLLSSPESKAHPGAAVYKKTCQQCHNVRGMGISPTYPPLAGSEWVVGKDDVLIRIVLHGLKGPIKVLDREYNRAEMPAQALSDEEIGNVLTYIRKSWGNSAKEISTEQVADIRKRYENQSLWTVAELLSE